MNNKKFFKGVIKVSFSSELKEELSKISNHKNECCKLAELAGYLITNCNVVKENGNFILKMTTENSPAIRRVYNAFKNLYNIEPITNISNKVENKDMLFELIVENKNDLQKIFKNTLINIDSNLQIIIDDCGKIKEKECCMKAFIRGVFMGGGSITSPENANHLEIVLNNVQNANFINSILHELGINAKIIKRKKMTVIYIKDSEAISNFLILIGSNRATLTFEQTRVIKEYRNNMNRKINCEVANMDKIAVAASRQLNDILLLKKKKKFDDLSEEIKNVALLREEYPEASLEKIGEMLEPKLSKAGVSHRFKKIKIIADELRKEE